MRLIESKGLHKIIKMALSLLLITSLILSMIACSGNNNDSNDIDSILNNTANMMLQNTTEPTYGSVGGEWLVFGMARWGGSVPEGWFESYYEELERYVEGCHGILDERKYTEYSRVIIALTAMGKNPLDVAGYNLLTPLGDFEKTTFQGINGPIFALLALDSGNYEMPTNSSATIKATREMYIDFILDKELDKGGWALSGTEADVDITAMVIQALAKYQDNKDVKAATDRALDVLSKLQTENGGFSSYGAESSESISQVIVALTELEISIDDERFVKNGKNLEDSLLEFMIDGSGFEHILEGGADPMATEQAFYALVALNRSESGLESLYRM